MQLFYREQTLDWKTWSEIGTTVAGLTSVLLVVFGGAAAVIYYLQYEKMRENIRQQGTLLEQQRNSLDITSLFGILVREWLDKAWSVSSPIVDGVELKTVREAKYLAESLDIATWKRMSCYSSETRASWQCKLAMELGLSLERVGVTLFAGAITPRLVLPL
jgi:hypothetical protein